MDPNLYSRSLAPNLTITKDITKIEEYQVKTYTAKNIKELKEVGIQVKSFARHGRANGPRGAILEGTREQMAMAVEKRLIQSFVKYSRISDF